MESTTPLVSPDAFAAFRAQIESQLQAQLSGRKTFLESSLSELAGLLEAARLAGAEPLVQELTRVANEAQAELDRINSVGGSGAAAPSLDTAAVRKIVTPSATPAAAPAPPRTNGGPAIYPPAIVAPVPSRRAEDTVRAANDFIETADTVLRDEAGPVTLIRLKAMICRERMFQAELAAHGKTHYLLDQFFRELRRRIEDDYGRPFLLPLRPITVRQDEPEWEAWEQFATLYDGLADATAAMLWYQGESGNLKPPEKKDILESLAAHQTRIYRFLRTHFTGEFDEHQNNLFFELRRAAQDEGTYLECLTDRASLEQLAEHADMLSVLLSKVRKGNDQRARRDFALASLVALLEDRTFGTKKSDGATLAAAVAECRASGIPASNVTMRRHLADWLHLIEDDEEKSVQEVAEYIRKDMEKAAAKAEQSDADDSSETLSEAEQEELDAVRAAVRGKRCLFIGGLCHEQNRAKLEKELELAELIWPNTRGTESVYDFEPEIQKTDITVVLTRWMRTGWKQARELAVKHNKLFVRLPSGYGLRQVVRQLYLQVAPEAVAEPAK